ncbi:MAG TPA: tRNA (adenosine(37)-N6)-threonylcarbamoyltransferase complex ATPase subunit type 1 TsaE [Bryobacteraceae bacterium]|jgi:tRNA threonylcarbamoyladenosine biosynthesis protein TsaE|nr:tRNA (adenosine(37)-N6)-threonylcarbamoyltransferase complex ATPase subunit type 1 TsaE [Bryobacteraceae bacterium]
MKSVPSTNLRESVRSFDSRSAEETESIGRALATLLPATGIVLLIGELGAGKTALTKGILDGRGLARPEDVASPTFTLIHEYGEPVRAYHIDLYRLETADEARRLGLEDLFEEPALVLIEWGDRFPELLPADRIEIRLQHTGENSRHIEVFAIA